MDKRIVKDIPLLDAVAFLLETVESPKHVGMLQVFMAPAGKRDQIVRRVIEQYRNSEVAPPFNFVPVIRKRAMPKWAECPELDMNYHVRRAALPKPGTEAELLALVTDLHATIIDRSQPCWIAYVIEGLEKNQFAIYLKVHHAYIDGASGVMRMDAALPKSASSHAAVPLWAPLVESTPAKKPRIQHRDSIFHTITEQRAALAEVRAMLRTVTLRSAGWLRNSEAPLPFTAPRSSLNAAVSAPRAFGAGSLPMKPLRDLAKQKKVSINEVVLALVGESLENYMNANGERVKKPLVAACPMNVREGGDTDAGTQIAAITIKLGDPGAALPERIKQVHESSTSAKQDAGSMSRNGLIDYLAVIGGVAELLDRSQFRDYLPPLTNVNVSNVPGPREQRYLSGAKLVRTYPFSTLVGGTAINITFFSIADRMEYGVITDSVSLPGAQIIADDISAAFLQLQKKNRRKRAPSKPRSTQRGRRQVVKSKSLVAE